MQTRWITVDGNEAAARIAYRFRRERHADGPRVSGGGVVSGSLPHHRLRALHRSRDRDQGRLSQQAKAVASGHWPLFRFDPRLAADHAVPPTLDSKPPTIPFGDYAYEETRYRLLRSLNPETARMLALEAQHDIDARWALYESLAKR
jgi:hypothetical protein